MTETKILLSEKEMPTQWYNIQADLPKPLPPVIHPATGQPITPDDLAPLFPMALIEQEVSQERWIDIPEEVRDIYKLWRPTPLYRAQHLEKALDTPAHIYYKWEGVSPPGKPQAQYRRGPGLLQQERGPDTSEHRDRGWTMGEAPWPSAATSSIWSARSTWSGSATTRNPTAAS